MDEGDRHLERLYTAQDGEQYHNSRHEFSSSQTYNLIAAARARKLQKWIHGGAAVLEIGVGPGWNLAKLNCGIRVGTDKATHLRALVESQGIRFADTIESLETRYFDVVLCHHVLEHLVDPFRTLTQAKGLLKQGGLLLIFVPYEFERSYQKFVVDEPNRHAFSWNVQTMSYLTQLAGFQIVDAHLRRCGFDRFAANVVTHLRLGNLAYRAFRASLRLAFGRREIAVVARAPT